MKNTILSDLKSTVNVKRMLFTFLSILFILVCSFTMVSQTYITSGSQLSTLTSTAEPGSVFIILNGSYPDFSSTVKGLGTADNPIIIRAETIGGVTLTGSSRITFNKAAHFILEGLTFNCTGTSTMVKLEGCNNIRLTRNVFELAQTGSSKWVYIGGVYDDTTEPYQYLSHDNRIDHNIFKNKTLPGHYITIDGTNEIIQSQNDRIDHNYFKNNSPRAENEQESIRIGWSNMSMSSGYTTVEYNLFEDCDGDPEIVSVKSCDNVIRHNTFLRSYGTLSLRHGNRNRVEGNYFLGGNKETETLSDGTILYTGGIRIYGTDHVIINNYMEGLNGTKWDAPITLTQGDVIDGQSTNYSSHFRAERITIAYNTLVNNSHGIEIGFDNNDKYKKALSEITIANNLITGSENGLVEIIDNNDQGANITWANNLFYPTGDAQTILGASSTIFNTDMATNQNPHLTFDEDAGIWRTSESSPLYSNAVEGISIDIDGQLRPATNNPGADHYSLESVRYAPMTPITVGPEAYEIDDDSESLYLSSISPFASSGGIQTVTVTSNVNWSVSNDDSWISILSNSGNNNGTFEVMTIENTSFNERTGVITITGGALMRTLNITQAAADPRQGLNLINDGSVNDKVTAVYAFHEEVTDTKKNIKEHTLDKDFNTQWAGNGKGNMDGLVFDLGGTFDLKLIDIATTNGKTYELEIWVSTTGTNTEDFVNAFPGEGNLVSNTDASFKAYVLPAETANTKYVKIIGYGQASSDWNTIQEIEFYGNPVSVSVKKNDASDQIKLHPNPAKDIITISNLKTSIRSIQLFSTNATKVIEKKAKSSKVELDVSSLPNGIYMIVIIDNDASSQVKKVIVSH